MGVPALFRWLSNKYPKIISPVIEERPQDVNGEQIPVDISGPNPNGEEQDNLYLDMNGIVHPCSHPEDRPAPATEGEMMVEIFKYTERVVNMVRPRKLLMIAIDGVAPRAKMNQQRSRRFRTAKEAKEKDEDKAEFLKLLKQQNGGVLPAEHMEENASKKTWDSNAITPGTPFMNTLALSLRYWISYKLNTDPGWKDLKIIISDASVPGEGEHKIMNFIRAQRSSPDHDPNTRHVIYGLDADLIMLGLATHEPYFRVLREDVFFQESKGRTCRICGQLGHFAAECRGEVKKKTGEFDEKAKATELKPYIWLHVSVLREYLEVEMRVSHPGFKPDLERAIDDWIFMCFFVGNDFLPHLPSLDIREQGIDTLISIWRGNIPVMGGYVTKDGYVDFARAQHILDGLAKQEDGIFKRRKEEEDRKSANAKRRSLQSSQGREGAGDTPNDGRAKRARHNEHKSLQAADFAVTNLDSLERNDLFRNNEAKEKNAITHDLIMNRSVEKANKSAAALLKERLAGGKSAASATDETSSKANGADASADGSHEPETQKRKREGDEEMDGAAPEGESADGKNGAKQEDVEETLPGDVRMWEAGYRDRYYEQKFHKGPDDLAFRHKVARDYAEGLQWVLLYYFQGCPSWNWYYPHHYAPFAADFVDIGTMSPDYDLGKPFRPYEQLMGVMPVASRHTIPEAFHSLMMDEDSDIAHFYPDDFPIDLNGKKWEWQGVALLPFIDEKLLLNAMGRKYPLLSEDEVRRNGTGKEVLIFGDQHPLYETLATKFYSKKAGPPRCKLVAEISGGLIGHVEKNEDFVPSGTVRFPLDEDDLPDIESDRSMSVNYEKPISEHVHKSMILRGVKFPTPVLTTEDKDMAASKGNRHGRFHNGAPMRGHGRGFRGGHRGGSSNHGAAPSTYDSRPNPFGAHINPALPPPGMPQPVHGYGMPPPGMAPPPAAAPAYGYGYPGAPGQSAYGGQNGYGYQPAPYQAPNGSGQHYSSHGGYGAPQASHQGSYGGYNHGNSSGQHGYQSGQYGSQNGYQGQHGSGGHRRGGHSNGGGYRGNRY